MRFGAEITTYLKKPSPLGCVDWTHFSSGLTINKDLKGKYAGCGKGETRFHEISGAPQEAEPGVEENVRPVCQSVSAGEGRERGSGE